MPSLLLKERFPLLHSSFREILELGAEDNAGEATVAVEIRRSIPVALAASCGARVRQAVQAEVCGENVTTEALLVEAADLARTEQLLVRELYSSPLFLVQVRSAAGKTQAADWIDADILATGSASAQPYLWEQPWIEIEPWGVMVSGRARGVWNSRSGYFHRRIEVSNPELRLIPIPNLRVENDDASEKLFEVALMTGIERGSDDASS